MWITYLHCCVSSLTLRCRFAPPFPKPLPPFPLPHISLSLSLILWFFFGVWLVVGPAAPKKKILTLGKFPTVDRPNWVKSPKSLSHDQSLLSLSFSPQSSELSLWPELLLPLLAGKSLILSPGFFKKCCIPVPVPVFVHHRLSLETTTVLSILFMEEL